METMKTMSSKEVKAGDMVRYKDNTYNAYTGLTPHLTIGKEYKVCDGYDPLFVTVENDDGDKVTYFKERFETV